MPRRAGASGRRREAQRGFVGRGFGAAWFCAGFGSGFFGSGFAAGWLCTGFDCAWPCPGFTSVGGFGGGGFGCDT